MDQRPLSRTYPKLLHSLLKLFSSFDVWFLLRGDPFGVTELQSGCTALPFHAGLDATRARAFLSTG